MAYNACTMHKLIEWFIQYVQENEIENLWWRMDPVTNPNMMRIEHIPIEMREEAIKELQPLLNKSIDCHTTESIYSLEKALLSNQIPKEGSFDELVLYTKVLDSKRNQLLESVFPHLKGKFLVRNNFMDYKDK